MKKLLKKDIVRIVFCTFFAVSLPISAYASQALSGTVVKQAQIPDGPFIEMDVPADFIVSAAKNLANGEVLRIEAPTGDAYMEVTAKNAQEILSTAAEENLPVDEAGRYYASRVARAEGIEPAKQVDYFTYQVNCGEYNIYISQPDNWVFVATQYGDNAFFLNAVTSFRVVKQ